MPYERIPHTADAAIRVWGGDVPELFVSAATGLFALMTEPPAAETVEREIILDAVDTEALLVDWLNELITLHEVEGETYTRFIIDALTPTTPGARVAGGPTAGKYLTVKAATYHTLHFEQTARGVETTVVFDV